MIQFIYFSDSNIYGIVRELEELSRTHDIIHFSLSSVNQVDAFQRHEMYHYCIVQYKEKQNINIGSLR